MHDSTTTTMKIYLFQNCASKNENIETVSDGRCGATTPAMELQPTDKEDVSGGDIGNMNNQGIGQVAEGTASSGMYHQYSDSYCTSDFKGHDYTASNYNPAFPEIIGNFVVQGTSLIPVSEIEQNVCVDGVEEIVTDICEEGFEIDLGGNEIISTENSQSGVAKPGIHIDEALPVENNLQMDRESNTHCEVNIQPQVEVPGFEESVDESQSLQINPEMESDSNMQSHETTDVQDCSGRPRKGRKRKYEGQSREDRKKLCITNKDYINQRGKEVLSREFRNYQCGCNSKCYEKVSEEERKLEFETFWKLDSYASKCLFVSGKITVKPVTRKRSKGSEVRNNSRIYNLAGKPVCKTTFLQTLRISSCRVNEYLKKSDIHKEVADMRGCCGGKNAISSVREKEIIDHINKFPKYKSHYCRNTTSQEFLTSDTTLEVMYDLYKNEVAEPVSYSKYKALFYAKFNLKRKPLKKDTCNTCDMFIAQKPNVHGEKLVDVNRQHDFHLNEAQLARDLMNEDLKRAKEDPALEVLTFDMEKTLPLPRIPTNIVFYKRQLWLYNCGIHSGSNGKGYCYVWLEGEAGRGAQEIGSCLRLHCSKYLEKDFKEVILWSDSCGGQNRNIKITLMAKAIMQSHPSVEKITHKFLISGHSFLPNDSEFSDIECALKYHQRLYTAEDYINVIEKCRKRNKFVVTRMKNKDFVGTSVTEKCIVNRKKDVLDNKVNWMKTRQVTIFKSKPFRIFLQQTFDEEAQEVNLEKKYARRHMRPEADIFVTKLVPLWPAGKPISAAKKADIDSLMHLIPGDAKEFYERLVSGNSNEEDIDAFNGSLDFDIEIDNRDM